MIEAAQTDAPLHTDSSLLIRVLTNMAVNAFEAGGPDDRVRVGMSADARVEVRRHKRVLLVPNTALVRTEQGAKVRVLQQGEQPELVPVVEGNSDGFRTVALRGLSEGDNVLVRSDGVGP